MIVLSILLTILKWIGIILLSLLCLILLLCLVILFVPIKYKISSVYTNDKKYFKANISWILNILRFRVYYNIKDSKFNYSLKCFFSLLFGSDKKVKSKNIKPKKIKSENSKDNVLNSLTVKDDGKEKVTEQKAIYENIEEDVKVDAKEYKEGKIEKTEKRSFIKKIIAFFKNIPNKLKKIKEKIENKKYTINNLYDKIKNGLSNFRRWKEFLTHRISKRAYEHVKICLKKFWKSVRPKKWDLYLEFGFEDVATTGKGLAFMSAFLPDIKGSFNIIPNFQEKVFLLDTDLYGKVRLISFLICFLKIYNNKDVKKTYRKFKKMK